MTRTSRKSAKIGLGNSPNKETRKGNKAVFDNTIHYHMHSEITGHFCKLIPCHQQCNSFTNRTFSLL